MSDEGAGVISEIRDAADPPGEDDVEFEAPWQARTFAITVALRQREAFPWESFQHRLIEELDDEVDAETAEAAIEAGYYEAWLSAIEGLLTAEGIVDTNELRDRAEAFASGERDASEFVVGEHGHPDDHSHGHAHGHSHDHPDDHSHEHDR